MSDGWVEDSYHCKDCGIAWKEWSHNFNTCACPSCGKSIVVSGHEHQTENSEVSEKTENFMIVNTSY